MEIDAVEQRRGDARRPDRDVLRADAARLRTVAERLYERPDHPVFAAIGELDALAGRRRRFDRDDALDLLAFIRASLSSAA